MAEYIEREAARNIFTPPLRDPDSLDFWEWLQSEIDAIPAADVRPVVRGKWKQIGPKEAACSACGAVTATNGIDRTGKAHIHKALYHFCPNCGADMGAEEGE